MLLLFGLVLFVAFCFGCFWRLLQNPGRGDSIASGELLAGLFVVMASLLCHELWSYGHYCPYSGHV